MSTWTMDQVWAVSRMWVQGEVSEELAAEPWAREALRDQHARQLVHEARVHAVEIHPDDVKLSIGEREERTFTRTTRAWWEPATDELELLGGFRDGEVFRFAGARHGEPFRTPGQPLAPTLAPPETPITLALHIDTWTRHGWNEEARRWVYTPGR